MHTREQWGSQTTGALDARPHNGKQGRGDQSLGPQKTRRGGARPRGQRAGSGAHAEGRCASQAWHQVGRGELGKEARGAGILLASEALPAAAHGTRGGRSSHQGDVAAAQTPGEWLGTTARAAPCIKAHIHVASCPGGWGVNLADSPVTLKGSWVQSSPRPQRRQLLSLGPLR